MALAQTRKANPASPAQTPGAAPQDKHATRAKVSAESALAATVGNPGMPNVSGLMALQAAVGNRAVMGLLQPKRVRAGESDSGQVHEAAKLGISGGRGALPHLGAIQQSFGRHDVTGVVAHTGEQATTGAAAMGAAAFTMGDHVAFAGSADLRTAAHEAAHVVQQRAGVQLAGGVGQVGDRYEQHADAVANLVVQGRSAESLLDQYAAPAPGPQTTHSPESSPESSPETQRQAVPAGQRNAAGHVIQRAWLDSGTDELKWDQLRGGLQWYYSKSTRTMRFEPAGPSVAPGLEEMAHTQKSYRAWVETWRQKAWLTKDKASALSFSAYAQRIVETYPPRQYAYVGIGASSDLVLIYLHKKYGIESFSIPLSGVTNVSVDRSEWGGAANTRVKQYICKFVPQAILLESPRILLMDVTSGGNTLNVVGDLIREIITDHKGDPTRVTPFSLNSTIKPDQEIIASKTGPFPGRDEVPDPKNQLIKRKLSKAERRTGLVRAGTAVDRDVDFDYEKIEKLKKRVKKQKQKHEEIVESGGEVDLENQSTLSRLNKKLKKAKQGTASYYPVGYDRLITDENTIEKDLDSQHYKDFGRRHRKVDIKHVMSGDTNAEIELAQKPEKHGLDELATKLLEDGEE